MKLGFICPNVLGHLKPMTALGRQLQARDHDVVFLYSSGTAGLDALVLDTVQFYAELGAIQLAMPYVHVSNALHFDYTGYTPLCLYGWPHQTTPAALARNREGVAKFTRTLGRKVNHYAVITQSVPRNVMSRTSN